MANLALIVERSKWGNMCRPKPHPTLVSMCMCKEAESCMGISVLCNRRNFIRRNIILFTMNDRGYSLSNSTIDNYDSFHFPVCLFIRHSHVTIFPGLGTSFRINYENENSQLSLFTDIGDTQFCSAAISTLRRPFCTAWENPIPLVSL